MEDLVGGQAVHGREGVGKPHGDVVGAPVGFGEVAPLDGLRGRAEDSAQCLDGGQGAL